MKNNARTDEKLGFWKRLANIVDQIERTEADYVWESIRDLVERANDMEERMTQIEAHAAREIGS